MKTELLNKLNALFASNYPFTKTTKYMDVTFDLSVKPVDVVFYSDAIAYVIAEPVSESDYKKFYCQIYPNRNVTSIQWVNYFKNWYTVYQVDLKNGYISTGALCVLNKDFDKAEKRLQTVMKKWDDHLNDKYEIEKVMAGEESHHVLKF